MGPGRVLLSSFAVNFDGLSEAMRWLRRETDAGDAAASPFCSAGTAALVPRSCAE